MVSNCACERAIISRQIARFSASPALQLHQLRARAVQGGLAEARLFGIALGADGLVEALHLGQRIALEARPVQQRLPADEQHAELRAPVAEVIVRDDPVAQQPQNARQRVAQDRRADVADVHRLGHVGRAEIHHHRARLVVPARRTGVRRARPTSSAPASAAGFEPEIQEAGAGHLDLLAAVADLQLGEHVGGQLARIQLPGLGQRHQRVGLVVAELGIGAGTDQHGRSVCVRQDGAHGCLEALFDESV